MNPSRRRSRFANFQAPFIVSVACAAASPACGGRTDSGRSVDSTLAAAGAGATPDASPCSGEPPPGRSDSSSCGSEIVCDAGRWIEVTIPCDDAPVRDDACPPYVPDVGSSCSGLPAWLSCEYEFCYGRTTLRSCNRLSGLWDALSFPTCIPPPPLNAGCPKSLPVPGFDCDVAGLTCDYRSDCYGAEVTDTAACRFGQWLVQYGASANCDPAPTTPLCPEREIVAMTGCAYEGQSCYPASCAPGSRYREGHVCLEGFWQTVNDTCPVVRNSPGAI